MLKALAILGFVSCAFATCSQVCVDGCSKGDTLENCKITCGCSPFPNGPPTGTQTYPYSTSPQGVIPNYSGFYSWQSPPVVSPVDTSAPANIPTSMPQVGSVPAPASHGIPSQMNGEVYNDLQCSLQCVSMCESNLSPNCNEQCKNIFCSTTFALTSTAMEVAIQSQSWGGWFLGNVFIAISLAGLYFWAKKRLSRTKGLPRRMLRKINELNGETYYKL